MECKSLLDKLRKRFKVEEFSKPFERKGKGAKEDLFWLDLFHEVYVEKHSKGRDDLLFIVKWDVKLNCEQVEVFRKDATSLPSARDENVLWEQTLYLNVILHEFEYYVNCGVVTIVPGGNHIDEVKIKVKHEVYPSPSQRRMDKKDSVSDVAYPSVTFSIDNFENVFRDIFSSAPGEKVVVQLIAVNKDASLNKQIFLGAVDHNTLKDAYDDKDQQTRAIGLSSRLKNFSLKSRNSRVFDINFPCHFLRMRGPLQKGFAELAIRKQDLKLTQLQTNDDCTNTKQKTNAENFLSTSKTSQGSTTGSTSQHMVAGLKAESSSDPCTQKSWFNDSDDWLNIVEDGTGVPLESGEITPDRRDGSPLHNQQSSEDGGNKREEGKTVNKAPHKSSSVESKDAIGGVKTKLKSVADIFRKDGQSESETHGILRMYGYLTYVQLPWYTLLDDILYSKNEPAL